ncbi:MAG: CCA tRNA nucleotidyltransferase [Proteobacteria bacterium]|nr:CCA tRNA nucleotidyltransferase [Pseudomonadota bacterium]
MDMSPPWRTRPGVTRLLAAFPESRDVRFVGGCVRDALLGQDTHDIDLATTLLPGEVMVLTGEAGLKPIPTGIEHGTVTVLCAGDRFEITTLRRDEETHGRHATVAFSKDWNEDAARRDFTINALYLDTEGRLYDPHGGRADLMAGLVRFIGDPAERIREDALRILRFFRFVARFGKGSLDEASLAACREERALLTTLSRERVTQEITSLCTQAKASAFLTALLQMDETQVWQTLFEGKASPHFWRRGVTLEGSEPSLRRRLALLFWNTPRALETLRLPKALQTQLQDLFTSAALQNNLRIVMFEHGADLAGDWLFLRQTLGLLPHSDPDDLAHAMAILAQDVPPFPLTGHDLKPWGLTGKELGTVLRQIQHWWAREGFIASKNECLTFGHGYWQSLQKHDS